MNLILNGDDITRHGAAGMAWTGRNDIKYL